MSVEVFDISDIRQSITCATCGTQRPLAGRCPACVSRASKEYYARNSKIINEKALRWREKNKEYYKAKAKEWYAKNRTWILAQRKAARDAGTTKRSNGRGTRADLRYRMVTQAKNRAAKRGVPFELSVEDVVIPERCPVLGIELAVGIGKPSPSSPSLDRINPRLGYVRGNVMVISRRANGLKSDATMRELERLVEFLRPLHAEGRFL